MKGLLTKDFLVITKQMKLVLLVIPIMAITGGVSMACIAVLLGAMLPMTSMAYDEQSKWDELAVMMPYSKESLVLSKYVLGYLCMSGAAILMLGAQLIVAATGHGSIGESLFMLCFSLIAGLLLIAVNTPILFKFGTQKGRLIFIAFMGVTGAAGSVIREWHTEVPANLTQMLPLIFLVGAVILNVGSVFLSMRIKRL